MKHTRRWLAALLALTAVTPTVARAAGYGIYEQGAAALGMAGAVTASANDASAVFFNPSNLTRLDGERWIYAGATLLQPFTSFAGWNPYPGYGVTEEMESQSFFPPTIYYASRLNDQLAYGVGVNSPFGLGVSWKEPDQFTGRYIVTKADLRTINANLTMAWAPDEAWSFAGGLNALFAQVELNNRTLIPAPGGGGGQVDVASTRLSGGYQPGYGWNMALSFQSDETWRMGAYYRSKVVVHLDGDADFEQIPTGNAAVDANVAAGLPPDQPVRTVLRFPALWSAGFAWYPDDEWTVEADLGFAEWSLFRDLPIHFQTTPSRNRTIVEDYEDALQVRVGAERRMDTFTLRGGYYYDQAAAPAESVSPLLPDSGRNGATLGFGKSFDERWTLDVYELALFVQHRNTEGVNRDDYDGEYKSFVNALGLSLAYRW